MPPVDVEVVIPPELEPASPEELEVISPPVPDAPDPTPVLFRESPTESLSAHPAIEAAPTTHERPKPRSTLSRMGQFCRFAIGFDKMVSSAQDFSRLCYLPTSE
jgi:hypothetical protein